ncbi:hypothetical protein CASFOL_005816 [Castilleja foliolosa]|uniref:Uncharacterized protein n=1 Tax=Castilleja foliolosa TaxID=1961234 RepID=A0ABD3E4X3_9LAMI
MAQITSPSNSTRPRREMVDAAIGQQRRRQMVEAIGGKAKGGEGTASATECGADTTRTGRTEERLLLLARLSTTNWCFNGGGTMAT